MFHDLSFLSPGKSWPPDDDRPRQDAYLENKRLRDSEFELVWPDLVKYLRKGETTKGIDFCLDYPSLITTKTSDLILGDPPDFCLPSIEQDGVKSENPDETKVTDIVTRTNFLEALEALIWNLDPLGDAVLKLSKDENGQAKILNVDPCHWFPVTKRGTDEILQHVLAFQYKDGEQSYLEVEIHDKKQIEHRLYRLNESMGSKAATIGDQLIWAGEVPEFEPNPIGEFLVVTCHNRQGDGIFGKSSYKKSLKDILKKLIIRYVLENDVLDTFTRPTFFGPSTFQDIDPITKKPFFRPGGYIGQNPDPHTPVVVPGALVWDAHLGENDVSKRSLMDRLFDVSEMSPVLFAGNLAGLAESGTALRLRLTNTLAKCSRIRRKVDGTARTALSLALKLEGMDLEGLYVEWKDGLPKIPLEEAQRYALWANTPQFQGEVGGRFLLKEYGYSDEEAKAIMEDPTRNVGLGGM